MLSFMSVFSKHIVLRTVSDLSCGKLKIRIVVFSSLAELVSDPGCYVCQQAYQSSMVYCIL
jgi:hypothetical protein